MPVPTTYQVGPSVSVTDVSGNSIDLNQLVTDYLGDQSTITQLNAQLTEVQTDAATKLAQAQAISQAAASSNQWSYLPTAFISTFNLTNPSQQANPLP